jgi:hypothetical protein
VNCSQVAERLQIWSICQLDTLEYGFRVPAVRRSNYTICAVRLARNAGLQAFNVVFLL